MSKEARLPALSEHAQERITSGKYCDAYREREDSLLESHAQIATLAAQVEELSKERDGDNGLIASKEAGWAIAKIRLTRVHELEAKLAALLEGATVSYRVEASLRGKWVNWGETDSQAEAATIAFGVSLHRPSHIVEIITRERILDADGGEG